jgi:hypothetical protein
VDATNTRIISPITSSPPNNYPPCV